MKTKPLSTTESIVRALALHGPCGWQELHQRACCPAFYDDRLEDAIESGVVFKTGIFYDIPRTPEQLAKRLADQEEEASIRNGTYQEDEHEYNDDVRTRHHRNGERVCWLCHGTGSVGESTVGYRWECEECFG